MAKKIDRRKLERARKSMNAWPYTAAVWRRRKSGKRPKKGGSDGNGRRGD